MASKHELEIVIAPNGDVQVHVKGAKGKQCMKYLEALSTIGRVKEQKVTSEYYEPGPIVQLSEQTQVKNL